MPSASSDGGTPHPRRGTGPSDDSSSDGGGGDARGSADSAIEEAGDCRDVSGDNGSKGQAEHLQSGSSSLGKLEAGPLSDTLVAEDGNNKISSLPKEQTKSRVDDSTYPRLVDDFDIFEENMDKKSSVDGRDDSEAVPEKKSEIMDARNTKPLSVPGKGPAFVNPMKDVIDEEANVVQSSKKEIEQMDFQSPEEMNQRGSRLDASQLKHRSVSPIDSKVESKRPAIVCQYFSQGWCVNGKNCKFMHSIDNMNKISQQLGEGVATATNRYEPQADEGLSGIPERPTLFPERIHQWEPEESPMWQQYIGKNRFSSLQRDGQSSSFPADSQRFSIYKDGPGKYFSPNAEGNYPKLRNCLFPEYGSFSVGSSSLTTSSKIYQTSGTVSLRATSLEGLTGKKNELTFNDDTTPVRSHQLNPNVDTTQTTSLLPSHRSLARGGYSFSQNAGYSAHKLFDVDTKTKFSSDDWEPSVPFRPSYFAAFPYMSSAGSMHDIVCDTSKEHHVRDKQYKVPCSTQRASSLGSSHQQENHDPVLPGTLGPNYNGDVEAIRIHNKFHQSASDKGVHAHQKDLFANETKRGESSVAERQDSLLKKRKPVGHIQVQDVSDQNPINNSDGASHKEELKFRLGKPSNATSGDHKIDEDMNKESKTLKHFRFMLTDFIKDLLRPTWHKGHLSKDEHNSIVKKSVDKVLSTLEAHQIPSTKEAIHHYLSVSQPKIAKLVQGYVDKQRRMNFGISVP